MEDISLRKSPEDITARKLVERLYAERENFDIAEVFLSAVDIEEVLRLGVRRTELAVLTHMPGVVESLADKAKAGDVRAARTLLEVLGMIGGARGQNIMATQINITPQEVAELEEDLRNYGKRLDN
ncbi:hypothetical protein [Caldanaerobius polysaccharolyticus]|uniref:hypothetical protein n=1 Tax=Caldanaerobius polysaccharolyticus TaxID=44256 RepID=UPI00047D0F79|nr:hypothetical protein [Caldanaerobius polysaccharolyticus]